jgi:hypothetical protein
MARENASDNRSDFPSHVPFVLQELCTCFVLNSFLIPPGAGAFCPARPSLWAREWFERELFFGQLERKNAKKGAFPIRK